MKRRVVVVVGPTAVGKTAVACALQDLLGGPAAVQLISADSAMVYQGLDIGTAKPDAETLARHPHALVDIRDPGDPYTAADFVDDADRVVNQALAREQLPVIVGGTMLYVKRFVEGIADLPQADDRLRVELRRRYDVLGGDALHAELQAVDPVAAAGIHPNNPQRLLRALEVVRMSGRPMSEQWRELASPPAVKRLDAQVLTYAIVPDDRALLHARIAGRFDAMLAEGFLTELEQLHARFGVDLSKPALRCVGYRQGLQFLAGELSEDEFRSKAITATRRLAKRQLTWLRNWPDVKPLVWGDAPQLAEAIAEDLDRPVEA